MTVSEFFNWATAHGFDFSMDMYDKFMCLEKVFYKENARLNLSAIRTSADIWKKHFLDSLLGLKHLHGFQGKTFLDIGSGGGFPALPLAIVTGQPVSVLDSVGKKVQAIARMAEQIDVNISPLHARAEFLGQDQKFRENFDIVTARALAPWPVLLELCLPFVRVGGVFVAYQGPAIDNNLKIFSCLPQKLGGDNLMVHHEMIDDLERRIIVIHKTAKTSEKFPRKISVPSKSPLSP